jgi:hypothetical protein
MIWKHNAGDRNEMIRFDSNLVEKLVESAKVCNCDTIVDFLHRSYGELGKYDGFVNGFSEAIRGYAFRLSLIKRKCSTEALDNYNVTSKFINADSDDPIRLSNYTFIREIYNDTEVYFPLLAKLLITTDYKFKHRDASDVFLRKNIALLLNTVARSITSSQLDSLKENRRDYVNSLVLSQEDIKRIKNPSSKFPEKP